MVRSNYGYGGKSYAGNIKYFGSPEAYAKAIQEKLSKGQSLSDKAAAEQFMKDRPDLFTKGYVPVRSTFEQQGYGVRYYGKSSPVEIEHPTTGDVYRIKPTYIGGTAYIPQADVQKVTTQLTPYYEKAITDVKNMFSDYQKQWQQAWTDYYNTAQQQINNYMQQMNNYISQIGNVGIQMLNAYQQQYSQALGELQQYLNQKPEVPDSVKLALDLLKKQTDENIKALNEEMNRRGIYNSGIAAEEIRKAQEALGTAQAGVLAKWLDQYHNQMYQAVMQKAKMMADYAGNFATLYSQAYQKPLELAMQNYANVFNMQQQLAQQAYQQQAQQAQQSFDVMSRLRQALADYEQEARKLKQQREAARLQAEQERQKQLYDYYLKLLPYYQMTAYQKAQLDMAMQRLSELMRHNKVMEQLSRNRQQNELNDWLSFFDIVNKL